jgi:hypothetical protein
MSADAQILALGLALGVSLAAVVPQLLRAAKLPPRRKVSFLFERRDLWVGVYRDTAKRTTYICPLPCLVIRLAPVGGTEGDSQ